MQSKFTQTPFPIFSLSARTVILGFRVSGQYWVFSRCSPLVSGPGQHWWRGRSMHRWPCPSLGSHFHKWCRRLFLSTFQKVHRRCRKFQEGAKKVTLQLCTDNPGECWVSLRCLTESLCHLYNSACGHRLWSVYSSNCEVSAIPFTFEQSIRTFSWLYLCINKFI